MKKFIIPAIALFVGIGLGALASPEPETIVETKTVEKPVEKVVEKKVEVVPAICLEALEAGETVMKSGVAVAGIAAQYIEMIPRAAQAGTEYDVEEIETLTSEMSDLTDQTNDETDKVKRANYSSKADECRAAAN